jgi:hypothetical protein
MPGRVSLRIRERRTHIYGAMLGVGAPGAGLTVSIELPVRIMESGSVTLEKTPSGVQTLNRNSITSPSMGW